MRNSVRGGGENIENKKKKIGQMGPAVWDFVRMSRQWCVNAADEEMFGDDDVPFANAVG